MPDGHFPSSKKVETPSAVYLAARGEWSDRYGSYIVEAQRWRAMCFILAVSLICVSGALVWKSGQSSVQPFMVKVNKLGEVAPIGLLGPLPPLDPLRIRAQLAQWVADVRSVYSDGYAMRNVATRAYASVDRKSPALEQLNEWFRTNNPTERAARESVNVDLETVTQMGGDTWWAQWREDHVPHDGRQMYADHWSASFKIRIVAPKSEEEGALNPNGLYITEFHASRRVGK